MPKLYFRYGAMNSSKSANALMVQFNYEERYQKAILMKPSLDVRDGVGIIKSRAGLESTCGLIQPETDLFEIMTERLKTEKIDCLIVDEAQFLKKHHVFALTRIVDELRIPVICYGLRADFQANLFEGSKWLLTLSDTIEEVKTICWCGRKAIMNARIQEGRVVKEGEQIVLGGNDRYISLCRQHWKTGEMTGHSS